MHAPPTVIIEVLNDLDDSVAGELLALLRALTDALEIQYAAALVRQQQRHHTSRQPSLWPDSEPPF